MQKIFFTVGPSQLYPTAKKHIQNALKEDICSISHRSEKFREIYGDTVAALKSLLNIPENFEIFFLSSATEAMERVIQNCVGKNSFHFVNGAFSKRFFEISGQLGKDAKKHEAALGRAFDFKQIEIPRETELICCTQNETSGGTSIPLEDIYAAKKSHPDKLIAVDIVSSAPYCKLDYSLVDCAFFSVQKGFGLPAGLGVLIVNEKCLEKSERLEKEGACVGSYHRFSEMKKQGEKNQTKETPNVLGIYLLGRIVRDMLELGIERIRKETEEKAGMVYDFFDNHPRFKPFISEKNNPASPAGGRSQTVIVIGTPDGSKEIVEKLKKKGMIVGTGYKDHKDTQIRISNFPAHSVEDIKNLLKEFKNIN